MFSKDSSLPEIAEGATIGLLKFTKEEIKNIFIKLINKDIGFIGKKETISLLKKQRETEEWILFDKYIENKELRIIVQLGLTLRELEGDIDERKRLKEIISRKYGSKGVHIAQFVQDGFLGNYIGTIITNCISKEALKEKLEETLENIERLVIFIKGEDNAEYIKRIIKERIEVSLPKVLIMYSSESIMSKAKKIKEEIENELEGYSTSDMLLEKNKYICFFVRKDREFRKELDYIAHKN